MKIEQRKWLPSEGWKTISPFPEGIKADLILAFGDRFILSQAKRFEELREIYPNVPIVMASTSGNICGTNFAEESIVTTGIAFEKSSTVEIKRINIKEQENSYQAGVNIINSLNKTGLMHIFLISDGHIVNGSALIKGILTSLPSHIALTGGLAGDGVRFEKTLVGLNEPPKEGEVVIIGFYGPSLKFGIGVGGGWDVFGMERTITRSSKNILYELDGKPALELYKMYLGDQAKDLPGSALLFPLAIRPDENSIPIVRTILSINDQDQSMIFAGDVPEGWHAQLMKANFDRLVDAAYQAANFIQEGQGNVAPDLAILVSCVGRKVVLDQRVEEEIENVQEILGNKTSIAGFYSYGEIAPSRSKNGSDLHNQTMTITTISER